MSESQNKDLVRAYLEEVWKNHQLEALDRYIAADYVQHSRHATPGPEGLKTFFKGLWAAFTEQSFSVDDLIAEGDRVVWRWTMRARHTGPFLGISATGKTITTSGISIFRVAGGRFAEHWGEQDTAGLLAQLR